MRWNHMIVVFFAVHSTLAQAQHESALGSEFRLERARFDTSCLGKTPEGPTAGSMAPASARGESLPGCAQVLFTDHPLHIAVGSIAPQNGFGTGLAFVTRYSSKSWRTTWNTDAVASPNLSWRAGTYLKIVHTPPVKIRINSGSGNLTKSKLAVHPYTIFNIYAQSISLQKLTFFGLGNTALQTGRTFFGERETIIGGNAIKPVGELSAIRSLNLSLLGEANGRFVDLRGNHEGSSPSIEQLYNETSAPGLAQQPGFVQFGEGLRLEPILFDDHFQMDYLFNFQQFVAPSNSRYSFLRWKVDLNHEFPLYRNQQSSKPRDTNGPDECALSVTAERCPPIAGSRNRTGTIGVRLLLSESATSASSVVPFYFQQTLGGSDVNGNHSLSSYQDYRFRGPNLLLLRESFEHSIWGPLGFNFQADQGRVALTRGDIEFAHLKHSFATGLTLRAGGFPQIFLLFAWGGNEGHHIIGAANTFLLGGSPRPSLF